MKHYVDLHIRPCSPEQAQEMITLAAELGYKRAASTEPATSIDPRITMANRADIIATKSPELLDALKRYRKKFDVIAVKCLSKEVARQAAKDYRVDIILFPDDPFQRKHNWFDDHEAKLVEGTGHAYEINASDLIAIKSIRLSKVINQIKRDLNVAMRRDIPIILSSGATTPLLMREPRALTALASLLDVDEDYATDMVSTMPEKILNRNVIKLGREET